MGIVQENASSFCDHEISITLAKKILYNVLSIKEKAAFSMQGPRSGFKVGGLSSDGGK